MQLTLFPRDSSRDEDRRVRQPTAAESLSSEAVSLADRLAASLAPRLDFTLHSLTLTDNQSTFLSARSHSPCSPHEEPVWALRIHRCFCDANDRTLQAIADYLNRRGSRRKRETALAHLRSYFEECVPDTSSKRSRRSVTDPRGENFDLVEILQRVRAQPPFRSLRDQPVRIGWARWPRRRRPQRSVQLGSCADDGSVIRIHPVLDDARVPPWVVESIVFHELAHVLVPPEESGSRRIVHGRRFREIEALDPNRRRANEWIKRSLFRLLNRRKR